jgi:hypothetical protein
MLRLAFGIIIGALAVYLWDSRSVEGRREMLRERFRRGRVGDFTERADEAIQAGADTISDAAERTRATAAHAAERARETADEAKREAKDWASGAQQRADAVVNSPSKR